MKALNEWKLTRLGTKNICKNISVEDLKGPGQMRFVIKANGKWLLRYYVDGKKWAECELSGISKYHAGEVRLDWPWQLRLSIN